MACTPFVKPAVGLFINADQGIWNNFDESKGGRTCDYTNGVLTVTGPNGSTNFSPVGSGDVKHKFFGTDNYLAVRLFNGSDFTVVIVNFTSPTITTETVLFLAPNPPWVQYAPGSGSVCIVGAALNGNNVGGLSLLLSATGKEIDPGSGYPPFQPSQQIIGEALATGVQIKHGNNVIDGPWPYPSGKLSVTPASQIFPDVRVGGCPQTPPTKQFTLKNTGNDCLTISAIGGSGPYSVSAVSMSLPASLTPNQTLTVTVTFAPTAVGTFNVNLPVTRAPAVGDDKLVCNGKGVAATAAFTVPGSLNLGHILVGTTKAGTVTITNTGGVPIAFSVAPSPPGGPFQWAGFSGMLTCGAGQPIAVSFTPQAEGPANITMTVNGTPGGSKDVLLSGEGCIPNARIVAPPAPFPAFGPVRQGYRMVRFVTIENAGDGTLGFTASISGADAALFGLMKPSNSITDVASSLPYSADPVFHCGGGAVGDGKVEVAIVFHANAMPPHAASAILTIDAHNDPQSPPSFSYPLTAEVIEGNKVDVVGVFDNSGSMGAAVPGGGTKMAAAIEAGRLLVQLIPPDLQNRVAATFFNSTASTFLSIADVTATSQPGQTSAIADPPLTPGGNTAIAAGVMVGVKEFATPHPGGTPTNLARAMIVLSDGLENTAYLNPDDGNFYTLNGGTALNPGGGGNVSTQAFVPPPGIKIYTVGLGTGPDINVAQLSDLGASTGAYFGAVDPTQPAVGYQLMKFYTQIFMDMVDLSTIVDPRYWINPGDKHVIEFDMLRGDVGAMVVIYDLKGLRLPFYVETPQGEIVDAAFSPPGFQLRTGFTESSRFLDFVLPAGDPARYAGRWKVVVFHDGKVCMGRPSERDDRQIGFRPTRCVKSKDPVEYGIAIGAGSNFRLQAFVTPSPVKVGQPILLTGVPTEAGLPVKGAAVSVEALSPTGQVSNFTLPDDGAHSDGDPDDGEYARFFTQTSAAGSYTFTFKASGLTRDGEPVRREVVRSKYVEPWVRDVPPPGGGRGDGKPGGTDECCRKILKLLERQNKLLESIGSKRRN
jgi:hypothetical protein